MFVRCISTLPNEEQAKRLLGSYWPGKQTFHVEIGQEYIVFAMSIINGESWVQIEEKGFEFLIPVPLCLFEIVNGKVPSSWEVCIKGVNIHLWPSSFYKDQYYHDKLSDGDPEILENYREVKTQILKEGGVKKTRTDEL